MLAAASTTVVYDMNITTNHIIEWGMRNLIDPLVQMIMSSGFNSPTSLEPSTEVLMLSVPKKAFPLWPSCSIMDKPHPGAYWQCPFGGQHNAPQALHGYAGNRPPLI
jgi:hypothetical protein